MGKARRLRACPSSLLGTDRQERFTDRPSPHPLSRRERGSKEGVSGRNRRAFRPQDVTDSGRRHAQQRHRRDPAEREGKTPEYAFHDDTDHFAHDVDLDGLND